MPTKRVGKQTIFFVNPPNIAAAANIVGPKEGAGPLRHTFDVIGEDTLFAQKSWEKAEAYMQRTALNRALTKAGLGMDALDCIFAGDLLNQCIGTSFGLRETGRPLFGLYGACSTMAESLGLAAMAIDGGYAGCTAAITSSHFCSAERQYRLPLEYGGQRTPTAQWTVTGSGAVVLNEEGPGPYVTHMTAGAIVDAGVKDANNMGAAMAPAAFETISAFLEDAPGAALDAILTGDLGKVGRALLLELLAQKGIRLPCPLLDCGEMIYDLEGQDVHAGGSGCGCSASVLCGHLLAQIRDGMWQSILLCGTGALLSPVSTGQGESIPSICHAVRIAKHRS